MVQKYITLAECAMHATCNVQAMKAWLAASGYSHADVTARDLRTMEFIWLNSANINE